jgi:DNA-directed RNA polymerase beta' subunit
LQTHKLADIVKANSALRAKMEARAGSFVNRPTPSAASTTTTRREGIEVAASLLAYHVATLIDNHIPGVNPALQRTGRPLKSISERLKSKDGRIRSSLMGKRTDFSARSVITPDPSIGVEELGVPVRIATNLTFPEVVNAMNRVRLQQAVAAGPDTHPGARYVRREGEPKRSLRTMGPGERAALQLSDGDVVERHLADGDVVLLNRQPSLVRFQTDADA